MTRRKRVAEGPFADLHFVRGYIERRTAQLESDGPVGGGIRLGRAERDAILEFVRARRSEVSDLRTRTYLAWLPLAAVRLGAEYLAPTRDTPARFAEKFSPNEYARGSRVTVAQCLVTFWRWLFASAGKEFPSWLRIKLEKWKPTNGASYLVQTACSPRMWGCTDRPRATPLRHWLFPMHVGVYRTGRRADCRDRPVPHGCGGVPTKEYANVVTGGCSPRMWGCTALRASAPATRGALPRKDRNGPRPGHLTLSVWSRSCAIHKHRDGGASPYA